MPSKDLLDAVDYAIADCRRGTEIATKRFDDYPCREYAVIAMEAACRWFDLLRKMDRPIDAPMPFIKKLTPHVENLTPSDSAELKQLAFAHALYATEPGLSDYPWDIREEATHQKFRDKAKAVLAFLDNHNDIVLAPSPRD